MSKEIRLNAFAIFAPSHLSMGMWRHPRDRSTQYNTLEYWTDLAKTLERGKFDGIFIADGLGTYDVYQGSSAAATRAGVQFPRLDPILLVSGMAQVTEHLGFGITSSTTYEQPFIFARRMTTLDHLTKGRAGWNIVTSFGESGAKATGRKDGPRLHDDRYDAADEYLEVVYKLWEGSWDEGAARRDKESGVFTEPGRVQTIRHDGKHFQVEGLFVSEPSPQRTPVLYQAGTSTRGRQFAARHAECVFISAPSKQTLAAPIADIRRRAVEFGRDPADILVFALLTVIVGRTDEEAREKFADYRRYASPEATSVLFSGWSGIDFSAYKPNDPVSYIRSEGMQSAIESFTIADPNRSWTVGELLEHNSIGGRGPVIVGSPARVADEMQSWIEETGADGFNLSYALMPESYVDFVELVIPELQRRGVYKTEYRSGTLREKLYGSGRARLPAEHPAATHRTPAG
ncbi:LLM class flavin-dependent oxidoreductase [Bradyrhizobium sp.]|uniref:LLM class flavin-dependent oxidoreductase n=1 Tax=Bradyrhizobium sp. TaxID=376 RepID=UPI0039E67E1A